MDRWIGDCLLGPGPRGLPDLRRHRAEGVLIDISSSSSSSSIIIIIIIIMSIIIIIINIGIIFIISVIIIISSSSSSSGSSITGPRSRAGGGAQDSGRTQVPSLKRGEGYR